MQNVNKSQKKRESAQRTPAEVRKWLFEHGLSQAQFAARIGVPTQVIRDLLRNDGSRKQLKGLRGDSHKAAVALGMKPAPAGDSPLESIGGPRSTSHAKG